jgi:hypothetical protein
MKYIITGQERNADVEREVFFNAEEAVVTEDPNEAIRLADELSALWPDVAYRIYELKLHGMRRSEAPMEKRLVNGLTAVEDDARKLNLP